MSNPFDDTVADEYKNPFANNADDTPLPATSHAAQGANAQLYENLNPDSDGDRQTAQPSSGGTVSAVSSTVKSIFNTVTGKSTVHDTPINEADLALKEAALARKEREIEEKEMMLQNGTLQVAKSRKNFPPFIKVYAYHPNEDLPENARRTAKILFIIFGVMGIIYLINWIGCLATIGAHGVDGSVATRIVISSVYLFIFFPLSYEVGYFVYYNALVEQKALRFICFLIVYAIWGLIMAYNAIGFNDGSSVGWIMMIDLFASHNPAIGVIAVLFTIPATGITVLNVFMFLKLIKYYKSESFSTKAFKETATLAAQHANENRDTILEAAQENPDLVRGVAGAAASSYQSFT